MQSANPYQSPAADVAAVPGHDGFDLSGPFSPKGRFGRLSYIAWGALVGVAGWIAMMALGGGMVAMGPDNVAALGPIGMLIQVVLLVPTILFAIRRLHDFNASGWWSLLFVVPFVNFLLVLMLLFKAGTTGANRFAPPRETRGWEKVVGYIGIGLIVLSIVGIIAAVSIPMMVGH